MAKMTKAKKLELIDGYARRYRERLAALDVDAAWKLKFECCDLFALCSMKQFESVVDSQLVSKGKEK